MSKGLLIEGFQKGGLGEIDLGSTTDDNTEAVIDNVNTMDAIHEKITSANNYGFGGIDDKGDVIVTDYEKENLESYFGKDSVNRESDTPIALNFDDAYIKSLADKRKLKPSKLKNSIDDFARWTANIESNMNNKARPNIEDNTSRGLFQFNDDAIDTVKQRIANVSKRIGKKIPNYLQEFVDGKKDITDLTYNQQRLIFTINFAESKYSKIADLLDKKNYIKQYTFHHADKKVMNHYISTGENDITLAADKNIMANINGKKNDDYMNMKINY